MTITDIKNLIIKLNVALDAEHEKASVQGIMLLIGFTEEARKQLTLQALDELTNIENLKEYQNKKKEKNNENIMC